jgi:hypothetical protein
MTTPEAHTYRDALTLPKAWMSESSTDGGREGVAMMMIQVTFEIAVGMIPGL